MTLSDFLEAEQISPSRFAVALEVPPSTVLRLLKGERAPGLDLMRKIAVATNGRVMPNDFIAVSDDSAANPSSPFPDDETTGG